MFTWVWTLHDPYIGEVSEHLARAGDPRGDCEARDRRGRGTYVCMDGPCELFMVKIRWAGMGWDRLGWDGKS